MIHFIRLRVRALLYHLRMQQGFTNAQIRGAISLLILIFILFTFSCFMRLHNETKELLTKEEERLMDSLLCTVPVKKDKKQKYISYPSSKKHYSSKNYPAYKSPPVTATHYNLNEIDSAQLVSLRGIGPVLAARILKFRKALGGFYTTDQLYEIWGLDTSTTKKILPYFYIGEEYKPACVHINTADYYTLKDHPYITPPEASALMKYKKKRGKILSLSELEPMLVQYTKMKYYLCID